jgi:hypothetical protein
VDTNYWLLPLVVGPRGQVSWACTCSFSPTSKSEDKLASALGGGLRSQLLCVRVSRIVALHHACRGNLRIEIVPRKADARGSWGKLADQRSARHETQTLDSQRAAHRMRLAIPASHRICHFISQLRITRDSRRYLRHGKQVLLFNRKHISSFGSFILPEH